MNVNDCFSHELGGDTLSEYIYSNVKKKTKGDYFPAKNSEDLIGEVDDNGGEEEEPIETVPNNMIRYYAPEILPETTSDKNSGLHTNAFGATITSHTFENGVGTIEFEEDVTSIGGYAFYQCNVTKLVFPDTIVGDIGNYAFWNCRKLSKLIIPNPDNITSIGGNAFYYCTSLTSITVGNSVTSIGSGAFQDCTSLTSITIPNSVTSISNNAFIRCYFLLDDFINNSSLNAEENNYWGASIVDSENNGLLIRNNEVVRYRQNSVKVVIPDSVTRIGEYAFWNCTSLTSITIPSSVTSIGNYAFNNCSSLTSIIIGNSVTSIGSNVFSDCTSLTSITIGNSVTRIDGGAFSGCTSLTSIVIPNTVTNIGGGAFSGCTSLTSITSLATEAPVIRVDYNTFEGISTGGTLTVPVGATGYNTWLNALGNDWTLVEQ